MPDVALEVGVPAQVEIDPDPPVAGQPLADRGRQPIRETLGAIGGPAGPGQVVGLERVVVGGGLDGGHAEPVPGHDERPDRRIEPGVAVGQADLGQDGGRQARRSGRPQAWSWLPRSRVRWSCGHLLAFAPLGGLERRA